MSIWEDMLNRLTDAYNKAKESNIGKLLQLVASELEDIELALKEIERQRDVDEAEGYTLDRIGRNVLEVRNGKLDKQYRDFIKTKVRANLSAGDIETINEIAAVFIGDNFKSIREMWDFGASDPLDAEPAALLFRVIDTPEIVLPISAIDRVVAGGVRTYWLIELDPSTIEITSSSTSGSSVFDYAAALYSGPVQDKNSSGVVSRAGIQLASSLYSGGYLFPRCGQEYAGVIPFISSTGTASKSTLNVAAEVKSGPAVYPRCGSFYCGEEVA